MPDPRRPDAAGQPKYTKTKPGPPFRFPLCLLSFSEDREELAWHIMSYALVENGRDRIARKGKWIAEKGNVDARSEWLDSAAATVNRFGLSWRDGSPFSVYDGEKIGGLSDVETVFALGVIERNGSDWMPFEGFDASVWWHLAIAVTIAKKRNHALASAGYGEDPGAVYGVGHVGTAPGSLSMLWERYGAASAHVGAYESAVGTPSPWLSMSSRGLWGLAKGTLGVREFCILAAVYMGLEGRNWGAVPFSRMRYTADGFTNADAFAAFDPASVQAEPQKSVGDVAIPEGAPTKTASTEGNRIYRYDRARTFYQAATAGVEAFPDFSTEAYPFGPDFLPFRGEFADLFTPVVTARGLGFRLAAGSEVGGISQLAGHPLGPSRPLARDFKAGQLVVWHPDRPGVDGLLLGRVSAVAEKRSTMEVERAGQATTISRTRCWPAPAEFLPEGDPTELGFEEQAPEELPERAPRWGVESIRRTVNRLYQNHWFAMSYDGRARYYGRGKDLGDDELAEKVFDKMAYKVKAKVKAKTRRGVMKERMAALRRDLEAEASEAVAAVRDGTKGRRESSGTEPASQREGDGRPTPINEMHLSRDASPKDAVPSDTSAREASSSAPHAPRSGGGDGEDTQGEWQAQEDHAETPMGDGAASIFGEPALSRPVGRPSGGPPTSTPEPWPPPDAFPRRAAEDNARFHGVDVVDLFVEVPDPTGLRPPVYTVRRPDPPTPHSEERAGPDVTPDPPDGGGTPAPVPSREPTPEDAAPPKMYRAPRPEDQVVPTPEPRRPTSPPDGALDAAEAFRQAQGDERLLGEGGLYDQVVTADGRAWYVARDRADVEAERRRLAEGDGQRTATA